MTTRRRFLGGAASLALAKLLGGVSRHTGSVCSPYLQNIKSDRVSVMWTTATSGEGAVDVWNADGFSRTVRARRVLRAPSETGLDEPYWQHQTTISGLGGSTEYNYRVSLDGADLAPGEDLRFRTRGHSLFKFLALGDSGMATPPQRQIAERMLQERAALVLHTGDLAYPSATVERLNRTYFDYYQRLMRNVPFFPCPGNHDYYSQKAAAYRSVHDLPTETVNEADHGRYYSFDWGNAHFISIDSNDPLLDSARGFGEMLRWLDNDLRHARQFWRIVYFHHPPYAFGPNEGDVFSVAAREHLVPILERYDVPLVLSGHEHSYQRTHPLRRGNIMLEGQGTVYVTTGGGGATLYPVHANSLLAAGESVHHFVRADVAGSRMSLKAIRDDGAEIDAFALAPKPVISGIANPASGGVELGAGGLLSIYGWHFAPEERQPARGTALELSGVQAAIDDRRLPLLFVSPDQVNAQLPEDITGMATLRITTPNGSAEYTIDIARVAPALFPTVSRADGGLISANEPAVPGASIRVYVTGLNEAAADVIVGNTKLPGMRVDAAPGLAGVRQVHAYVPSELRAGIHGLRVAAKGVLSNVVSLPVGN
jgi:uncharacterized protein (TIGR03437 family)